MRKSGAKMTKREHLRTRLQQAPWKDQGQDCKRLGRALDLYFELALLNALKATQFQNHEDGRGEDREEV